MRVEWEAARTSMGFKWALVAATSKDYEWAADMDTVSSPRTSAVCTVSVSGDSSVEAGSGVGVWVCGYVGVSLQRRWAGGGSVVVDGEACRSRAGIRGLARVGTWQAQRGEVIG